MLNILHQTVFKASMHSLILVSQSPRRKMLLEAAGYKFLSDLVKISEIINENLSLGAALEDLARQKAKAYIEAHKDLISQKILLLTADTVVVFANRVLGKPENKSKAQEYLQKMSGKTHSVMTSICLFDCETQRTVSAVDRTEVEFKELTERQIQEYVATGDPMDKAGAYGLQTVGDEFIHEIRGAKDNVIGLPVGLFEKLLQENGWRVEKA